MKWVTARHECESHGNGTIIRIYREKKLDVTDVIIYAFWGLMFSAFLLFIGFNAGVVATANEMKSATEEVAVVQEDVEQVDFYSEDVPLTEEEQTDLHEASEEFGVDYHTMLGLIEKETNFKNISGDGGKASGYCQVWEYWWSDLMTDIGTEDLNNPKDNFRTACAIVAELRDQYGSMAGALTAYNKGSYDGTVSKYAMRVLENAEKWRTA